MSGWTDERKELVIDRYKEELEKLDTPEQQAEYSGAIVKDIAAEIESSVNGVRMILNRAGVYVKQAQPATAASASTGGTGTGAKRVSKAEAQEELTQAIAAVEGAELDAEIVSKLTGKAAQYLAGVLRTAVNGTEA